MRLVVALGGNALLHRGERPEASAQSARLAAVAPALARLADAHELVLVHGNGPQVGLLARESAEDPALGAPYPLGLLSAATQGMIGSLLQVALRSAGATRPVSTLVTHVLVDPEDPEMHRPEKLIGAVYDERRARALAKTHGWSIAADGGGWRRVVPSPRPRRILELDDARTLLGAGRTVVLGGGGGVPVIEDAGGLRTIDAVIDKDRTAALIAQQLDAGLLAILTDVPGVIADYGSPEATVLPELTPAAATALDLPSGSMGPKVEAASEFALATGRSAVIGPLEHAEDVVAGILGTRIRSRP
ncbi:MAG: carbamate kinase [Actinobacteria bacterium]|nr:carbamate kinase [Actinomycetota bacterium]